MVSASSAPTSTRWVSLDVLRGLTIAFMILVNNNGDEAHAYGVLRHSLWNGFTPTDLVFPTFLFLVGITIVLSTESRLTRNPDPTSLLGHIVRRSILLFALGLVVNGFPFFPLSTLRIYGVLQRIALCYLLGSLLYLAGKRVGEKAFLFTFALVGALVGYWLLLRWVPVPGYGLPGKDIPFLDPNANLVAYFDRHIFPHRLYEGTRDPEGLLSTLPALGTTLIGMLTGLWLRSSHSLRQKAAGILAAGMASLLCGSLWNLWFPINKKLWTSSYVLYAAGWSLLLLALCYWLIEVRKLHRGLWLWLVFGKNAITAYVFAELLEATTYAIQTHNHITLHLIVYRHVQALVPSAPVASLVFSVGFVAVCWVPMYFLYRKNIFLKV
jgi:predicted acyltransferase